MGHFPSLAQLAERLTVVVSWASTCRWFDSGSSDFCLLLKAQLVTVVCMLCAYLLIHSYPACSVHSNKRQNVTAVTGNRTPVSRVTGGDNYHYTMTTRLSDSTRGRTWNLRFRRPTLYPLSYRTRTGDASNGGAGVP